MQQAFNLATALAETRPFFLPPFDFLVWGVHLLCSSAPPPRSEIADPHGFQSCSPRFNFRLLLKLHAQVQQAPQATEQGFRRIASFSCHRQVNLHDILNPTDWSCSQEVCCPLHLSLGFFGCSREVSIHNERVPLTIICSATMVFK